MTGLAPADAGIRPHPYSLATFFACGCAQFLCIWPIGGRWNRSLVRSGRRVRVVHFQAAGDQVHRLKSCPLGAVVWGCAALADAIDSGVAVAA